MLPVSRTFFGSRMGLIWLGLLAAAILGFTVVVGLLFFPDSDGESVGSRMTVNGFNSSVSDRWAVVNVDPGAPFLPVLANFDLAVGANRLSFTIRDSLGQSRGDLTVRVGIYDLKMNDDQPISMQFAQFISYAGVSPRPSAHKHAGDLSLSHNSQYVGIGVYVVPAFFSSAGIWGLEFLITPSRKQSESHKILFQVDVGQHAIAPNVGDQAPSTPSKTIFDETDIRALTSDPMPEPGLYRTSIPEALRRERPIILVFSTPAFCHSRICAPAIEVVKSVWREYVGKIDAIHIEVFENPDEPDKLREAPAFIAWRLPSEPWVFVIDKTGHIKARFEGTVTEAEVRAEIRELLSEEADSVN